MPLNRPPLALGQGARGVQDARRWVAELCTEIGRPELVECAQLGVSELVTNALIHARTACAIRAVLDGSALTVTVRDGGSPGAASTVPLDDPLRVHGRGLQLVDSLVTRWRSQRDSVGTTVWFVLES